MTRTKLFLGISFALASMVTLMPLGAVAQRAPKITQGKQPATAS